MSVQASDRSYNSAGAAYLVIYDSISQILDEAVQRIGVVGVLQEFRKFMLLG